MDPDLSDMLAGLTMGEENDLRKRVASLESLVYALIGRGMDTTEPDPQQVRVVDDAGNLRFIISPYSLQEMLGIEGYMAALDAKGTPQFWVDADTGKSVAGGGDVSLGDDGILTHDHVPLEFKARNNFVGDLYSSYIFAENSHAGLVLISNARRGNSNMIVDGDFESGGLSNWNVTLASNASITSDVVHGGSFALMIGPYSGIQVIRSAARFAITAGKIYLFQLFSRRSVFSADFRVQIEYWNASSGGTLIERHDLLEEDRDTATWQRSIGIPSTAPVGATYANIFITLGASFNGYIDDMSLVDATLMTWMRATTSRWEMNRSINILAGNSYLINDLPIPHNSLGDVGTNTHAQIDAHLALPRWTTVRKTSDESRAANTTLTTDSELLFAMSANKKYAIRGRIWFDTPAAADFKWRNVAGGTPTRSYYNWHCTPCGSGTETEGTEITATGTTISILGTGTAGGLIEFDGIVQKENASNNWVFQWAQNTSNAGNTIVLAGSYIEYMEI
jgi:hypothetical protein